MQKFPVILASSSTARFELLSKLDIVPIVLPADVDETELPLELPHDASLRLAKAKASKIAQEIQYGYIIGADTIAAIGRRIMPKALDTKMVSDCLKLYSGRRHKLYTGVHIIKKDNQGNIELRSRVVQTIVQFKNLTSDEIAFYANCGEGIGKAGGYSIQGKIQGFISFISGSVSNVIGLPLFETRNMLTSLGWNEQLEQSKL